jgi:uncharacterized protein (DUF2236 family)
MTDVEMPSRLFSPQSIFWRVNREGLTALAGPRALLLELAHPLVAEGVARHSDFQRNPLGRLYRTMRAMTDITFGSTDDARRAAQHIQRCHQPVHGFLQSETHSLPFGARYAANDPLLKLWVLATLVDSSLLVYDQFVAPLSLDEKQAYYEDSRRLGQLLDIPSQMMPATYADFLAYMDAMLKSELIKVSDTARTIMRALFAPPLFGFIARRMSFVSIGLLPPHIREAYTFPWDARRETRLHRLAELSRRIRPWLPSIVCVNPGALWAEQRLSDAQSEGVPS